jgi:hypothetical protein
MRHPIVTAPKDGAVLILEDEASGTYIVAYWSTETGEWIGKNREPSRITPTHWHEVVDHDYFQQEIEKVSTATEAAPELYELVEAKNAPINAKRARRRFGGSWTIAALIGAALIVYTAGYSGQEHVARTSTIGQEPQRSLQQEREKTAALVQEASPTRQAMTESAEQDRRALEEQRSHTATLENELAAARREIEMQAAASRRADDNAVKDQRDAESAIAELRQSLQQEREKAVPRLRKPRPRARP